MTDKATVEQLWDFFEWLVEQGEYVKFYESFDNNGEAVRIDCAIRKSLLEEYAREAQE